MRSRLGSNRSNRICCRIVWSGHARKSVSSDMAHHLPEMRIVLPLTAKRLHGVAQRGVPAVVGCRALAADTQSAAHDQPFFGTRHGDIKQALMLLQFAFLLHPANFGKSTRLLGLTDRQQGRTFAFIHNQFSGLVRLFARIGGRIGKDNHRRLQPFGTVDGHHPHLVSAALTVALDLDIAAVEPCQKRLQATALLLLELQCGVEHLLHRHQRFRPKPCAEFTPAAGLTRENLFQKMVSSGVICAR